MRAIVELGHAMKPNKKVLAVLLELVCTGEAYLRYQLESVAMATSPAPPSRLSQLAILNGIKIRFMVPGVCKVVNLDYFGPHFGACWASKGRILDPK